MAITTHAKFYFNQLMLTLIFVIRAFEPPPRAWRTTEKAEPDGGGGEGEGLRGPDDQIHSCHSEISYPMMPKLCNF